MTPASPRSLRHITSSDEANSAQRRCRCAMAKRITASKDGIGPSWRPTGAFGVACRHAAFLAPSRSRQQCARVNTGAWLRLMKGLWTYLPFTETATSRVVSLSSVASHRMSNVMADPRFQKETGVCAAEFDVRPLASSPRKFRRCRRSCREDHRRQPDRGSPWCLRPRQVWSLG